MKLFLLILAVILALSSCTSMRYVNGELYKKAVYNDRKVSNPDSLIYERLYSCEATMKN